jgi:membrane-bound lytic murein transglycosylase F
MASKSRDLAQILTDGKIVAVTDYTSTNYFIYKGEPMGYQYEMLVSLAENLGVKLELITENNPDEAIKMLKRGEVDIIANDLTGNRTVQDLYKSTIPYRQTNQVLIQRKVSAQRGDIEISVIRNLNELANKKIFVNSNSASAKILKDFSFESKIPVNIVENSSDDAEHLIDLVATGSIDYVVCDYAVAKVQATIYSNIDIETPIGSASSLSWAVSNFTPDLLRKVDEWLTSFPKTTEYSNIFNKYYDNPYMAIIKMSDYFYANKGKLSVFDEQIKSESNKINWDWRLLASLIYQESRFNPTVKSESGAYGLMQFMPNTSEYFGINNEAGPSVQLRMGARYLKMLEKYMTDIKVPEKERLKFVLAAYNAGYGHIIDARNLARKYGKDPNVWDNNVAFFIQNKDEFYNDSVVRHGYLRGSETYNYVNEILERYDHYKNIIKQ